MEDNKNKDLEEDEELKALRLAALATLKSRTPQNIVAEPLGPSYTTPINSIVTGASSVGESDNSHIPFVHKSYSTPSWKKQNQQVWRSRPLFSKSSQRSNFSSHRSNLIVISPISLDDDKDDKLGGEKGVMDNKESGEKLKATKLLPQFKWCGSGTEDSMSPKTVRRTGPTRFNRHGSDTESSDSDYTEDSDSDSGSNETVLQDEPPGHLSPSRETVNVSENTEKQRWLSFHNFESDVKSDKSETISVYNCLKNSNASYNNRSNNYCTGQNQDVGTNAWDQPLQNNYTSYNQYNQSYSSQPNSLTDYSRHHTNSAHFNNSESHIDGANFVERQSWQHKGLETGNSYYTTGNTPVSDVSRDRHNTNYFLKDTPYTSVSSRNTSNLSYSDGKKEVLTQNDLRLELKKRLQEFGSKTENSGNTEIETYDDESSRRNSGDRQKFSQQSDSNPSSFSYRNRRDRSYSRERFQSEHSSRVRELSLSQERERKHSMSRDETIHCVESAHSRSRYEEKFYHKRYQQEYNSRDKHEQCSSSHDRSRHGQRSLSRDRNRHEQHSSNHDRSRREQRSSSHDRSRREQRSSSLGRSRREHRSSSRDRNRNEGSFSREKIGHERSSSHSRNRHKPSSSQERSSHERSSSRARSRHGRSSSRDRSHRDHSSSQDKGRGERSLSRNRSRNDRSSSDDRSSYERTSSRDKSRYDQSSSGRRKTFERNSSRDRVKNKQNFKLLKVKPEPSLSQTRTKYDNSPIQDKTSNLARNQKDESDNYEKSWSDCSAGREKICSKRSSSQDRHQQSSGQTQSKHKYSPGQRLDSGSSPSKRREDSISSQNKKHVSSEDKNRENCTSTRIHSELDLNSTEKRAKLEVYSGNQGTKLNPFTNQEVKEDQLVVIKRRSQERNRQRSKSREKCRVRSRSPIQSGRSRDKAHYSRSRSRSLSRSSSSSYTSSSSHSSRPKIRSVPSVIKSVPFKSLNKNENETNTFSKSTINISLVSSQSDISSPSKRGLDVGDHNKNFKSDLVDSDHKSSVSDSNKRVPVHMRLGAFPRKRVLQMTKAVEAAFVNSSSSSDNESVSTRNKRQTIRFASGIFGNKSGTNNDRKPTFGSEKPDKATDGFREKFRKFKTNR